MPLDYPLLLLTAPSGNGSNIENTIHILEDVTVSEIVIFVACETII